MTDLITAHLTQFSRTRISGREPPRPNTIRAHRLALERFAEALADQVITINFCKNHLLGIADVNGASSVNQNLAALTAYLRWLADEGRISRDDLASWLSFHESQIQRWQPPSFNYKWLDPAQLARLFTHFRCASNEIRTARDVAFFGCILLLPTRLGELALLNCEHLTHLEADGEAVARFEIFVPKSIAKNHKDQLPAIFSDAALVGDADIYESLFQYWQWRRGLQPAPTDPLFVSLRKERFGQRASARNWSKVFKTAAGKAELQVTSHWLRHTYGERGRGVLGDRDMRQLYGHSSSKTTEGYTDHDDRDRLRAAQHRAAQAITNC